MIDFFCLILKLNFVSKISDVSQSICQFSSELTNIFSKSERLSIYYLWCKKPQPQNPKTISVSGFRPEDLFFWDDFQKRKIW